MKEKILAMAEYLKTNIWFLLATIVLLAPGIWKIADWHYSKIIEGYTAQVEALKMQRDDLQIKKDGYKTLVMSEGNSIDFTNLASKP